MSAWVAAVMHMLTADVCSRRRQHFRLEPAVPDLSSQTVLADLPGSYRTLFRGPRPIRDGEYGVAADFHMSSVLL